MRIAVLLIAIAVGLPSAALAYTEVPPFDATEFARQQGVFRWYRGCWWKVVDPNVYLLCNADQTVYIILPDGTLRQILREDAERNGLDDSGAGNYRLIHTGYDARGEGIDLPYGATAYERYRTLPISYDIRPSWTKTASSPRSYGSRATTVRSGRRTIAGTTEGETRSRRSGGLTQYAGGDDTRGTGVYRSDGTTGGRFVSVGTSGGGFQSGGGSSGSSGNSRIQEILSRGNGSSTYTPSSRVQEILSRGNGGSTYTPSARVQEILSRGGSGSGGSGGSSGGGGGSLNSDPDDFINRPRTIACSGPYDFVDGYLFGPVPCTWFPDVFGPVPQY